MFDLIIIKVNSCFDLKLCSYLFSKDIIIFINLHKLLLGLKLITTPSIIAGSHPNYSQFVFKIENFFQCLQKI